MTVLVCGGRTYRNRAYVYFVLDGLNATTPITKIVTGGATGADGLGFEWACARGVKRETYPAQWDTYGRAAGPIRNQEMLDQSQPQLVVAFQGSRGTKDMITRARKAGVRVEHHG